jgi:tyrosyl-tRNA synthetase
MKLSSTPEELSKILDNVDNCFETEEFLSKLQEKKTLKIKFGADPSRPDLHLGHAVVLQKLKQFQNLGHEVIFVIGDYTALIGDPTGKSVTRPKLDVETIKKNTQTYAKQVFQILDKKNLKIVYNSSWLSQLSSQDMIELMSSITVNQLLHREDFQIRYSENSPIHLHEFLYPLLQAYDSVHLKADVEIGGSDQMFNLLLGRQLQKSKNLPAQSVLLMPLIEGTDGQKKMSKSYGNGIYLTDQPSDFFGKLMSLNDNLFLKYFKIFKSQQELEQLQEHLQNQTLHPMEAKLNFAENMLAQFQNESVAQETRKNFVEQFSQKQPPSEMPTIRINNAESVSLIDLLEKSQNVSSKSEARRLISQRAVKINGQTYTNSVVTLLEKETIVKIGKRRYLKIIVEENF